MFYVYIHRKVVTNEVYYVGKGVARRAWKTDRNNPMWQSVFAKHGRIVEIVESGLQEWAAFEMEKDLIALYGKRIDGSGTLVNLTDGGDGPSGAIRTQKERENLSKVNTGKVLSEETKRKISLAKIGSKHSADSRKKMSIAMQAQKNMRIGKKMTDEQKHRMSIAKKGKCSPNHPWIGKTGDLHNASKAVICIETNTRYGSASEAQRMTGVSRSSISQSIAGKQKKAGGFSWKFAQ
jgi:hypothetical protein